MDLNELKALIQLLDDTDRDVYEHVSQRLLVLGEPAIPHLEEAWESSFDHLIQQRIENIIHQIQFDSIFSKFRQWKEKPDSLIEGAFLVARYQYPDLDEKPLRKMLQQMAKHVETAAVKLSSPAEKIKLINHILYEMFGFAGNKSNLKAPHNYYINHVLETKKGNHITLGILYIYLAAEAGMEIKGINIPDHFILTYMDEADPMKQLFSIQTGNAATIYINPFSKGAVFSRREIDHYLKQVGVEPLPEFYKPTPEISIIQRMLYNLKDIYSELGFEAKVEELTKLARILDVS